MKNPRVIALLGLAALTPTLAAAQGPPSPEGGRLPHPEGTAAQGPPSPDFSAENSRLGELARELDSPEKFKGFVEGSHLIPADPAGTAVTARAWPGPRRGEAAAQPPHRIPRPGLAVPFPSGPSAETFNKPMSPDRERLGLHLGAVAGLVLLAGALAWPRGGRPAAYGPPPASPEIIAPPWDDAPGPSCPPPPAPETAPPRSLPTASPAPARTPEAPGRMRRWWAITLAEQKLIDQWTRSRVRLAHEASLDEWLDLHARDFPDVDIELLKKKLQPGLS